MAVDPIIQQKAEDIRMKIYGKQVRESLASGLEAMSSDVVEVEGRQDEVEEHFQQVIDETTGKDIVSAPEIIAARNGKDNLKDRIDTFENDTNAQLAQKADEDEIIAARNGEANLKARLDKENQEVNAQLAQTNLKVVNIVNAKEFGAGSDKTNEENKTIIQTLINESVNENAGRKIIVPKKCEYGYDFEDPNTYLDFTGEFTDCIVEDYTEGDAVNASGMKKYGGQVRTWMCSPGLIEQNGESTGIGNTSANSTVIRGLWNPAVTLQVDGIDIDNRRVKTFYGALGVNYWSVGQGNMTIPFDDSEPEEINGNNEKRRRHFNIAGKTNDINAYQNKFVIRQDTGDMGFNIAEPLFDFHHVSNPNKDATLIEVLENRSAGKGVQSRLKTATQEIRIRLEDVGLNAGNFLLQDGSGNTFFKVTKEGTLEVSDGVACGKMTTEQRNALPNKAEGLMVLDSDLNKPVWFNGAVFKDATGLTV